MHEVSLKVVVGPPSCSLAPKVSRRRFSALFRQEEGGEGERRVRGGRESLMSSQTPFLAWPD